MKNPKRSNFHTFAKETPLKVHQDPYENRTRQIVEELHSSVHTAETFGDDRWTRAQFCSRKRKEKSIR